MVLGIVEICAGVILFALALIFGVIRMAKNPANWNFTKVAFRRWLVMTVIGAIGGLLLITFGIINIVTFLSITY